MSDLDRLLQQVEELKKLATRPDDTWMDNMSNAELQALGKRVRKVADGLTGLQSQLKRQAPSNPMTPVIPRRAASTGSLGNMVKQDQGLPAPLPPQPSMPNDGVDLSNPMQRRRTAPREGGSGSPGPKPPMPRETPPPGKRGGHRPNF